MPYPANVLSAHASSGCLAFRPFSTAWILAYTLTMIGGKWRLVILYWLVEHEAVRYNELQRLIGTITPRTLSTQLKEMEADGLIIRTEYPQIPPKVEYSLSAKGRSLYPIMEAMCMWGEQYQNK